jgi:hypothetical protein
MLTAFRTFPVSLYVKSFLLVWSGTKIVFFVISDSYLQSLSVKTSSLCLGISDFACALKLLFVKFSL